MWYKQHRTWGKNGVKVLVVLHRDEYGLLRLLKQREEFVEANSSYCNGSMARASGLTLMKKCSVMDF